MSNPFTEVVAGLKWLGKEIGEAFGFIKKVEVAYHDLEADAKVDLPLGAKVLQDAVDLSKTAVADGGKLVEDMASLIADAKSLNISAAVTAFETLVSDADNAAKLQALWSQFQAFVQTVDTFGADGEAQVKKLIADVS